MCFSNNHLMSAIGGGGPQVKKFEQVSSLHHQMSIAWGSSSEQVWTGLQFLPPDITNRGCPMRSHVQRGPGSLYSEVQCIMGNGHMENTPPHLEDRKTLHVWKHYLPAISLAGGNHVHLIILELIIYTIQHQGHLSAFTYNDIISNQRTISMNYRSNQPETVPGKFLPSSCLINQFLRH